MSTKTAERIKELRTSQGLTQTQFANLFGLTGKSTISGYESGKSTPDDEIKIAICKHFNCSLDWLLGVSNYKEPYSEDQSANLEKANAILKMFEDRGYIKQGEPIDEETFKAVLDDLDKILNVLEIKKQG